MTSTTTVREQIPDDVWEAFVANTDGNQTRNASLSIVKDNETGETQYLLVDVPWNVADHLFAQLYMGGPMIPHGVFLKDGSYLDADPMELLMSLDFGDMESVLFLFADGEEHDGGDAKLTADEASAFGFVQVPNDWDSDDAA